MKTKHLLLLLLLAAIMAPRTALAQKTHIASISSSTAMTWDEFASNVNNGTTYEGVTVCRDVFYRGDLSIWKYFVFLQP